MKKPTCLIIMDGFGIAPKYGNAIVEARTPYLDQLFFKNPVTMIGASGMDVGLPHGQMGNSEVGHTNMGAGRIVYQELTRITKSIEDGDFFENEAMNKAVDNALANDSSLHLFGLLSPGGVHSHNTHLYGILELCKRKGLSKVFIHAFLDGRDVPPSSAKDYVAEAVEKCAEIGVGKIATISGRYYAMDRDNRWERVEKAYSAIVYGEGVQETDPVEAVQHSYDNGVTDEFMLPTVIAGGDTVKANDSVIFYNFRPDRAREITRTFVDDDFKGFERRNGRFPVTYVCMTQYDATMPNVDIAFKPQKLTNTMGEYLSKSGKTQLRIAETEKYAHVTFFFNGGVEKQCEGEDRCLVPSPKEFPTYDLIPQMSAEKVCDKVIEAIASENYALIVCNFANCDMVGHTGVMDAAVTAVETVDACMGRIADEVARHPDVVLLVTADHGNADCMFDENGKVNTAHTTNPVPFCVTEKGASLKPGRLADIAPTILHVMGLEQPAAMTGECLLSD